MAVDPYKLARQQALPLESMLESKMQAKKSKLGTAKQMGKMKNVFMEELIQKQKAFEAALRRKRKKSGFAKLVSFIAPALPGPLRFLAPLIVGHQEGTKNLAQARSNRAMAEQLGMFGKGSRWGSGKNFLSSEARDWDVKGGSILDDLKRSEPSSSDIFKSAIIPAISGGLADKITFKELLKSKFEETIGLDKLKMLTGDKDAAKELIKEDTFDMKEILKTITSGKQNINDALASLMFSTVRDTGGGTGDELLEKDLKRIVGGEF